MMMLVTKNGSEPRGIPTKKLDLQPNIEKGDYANPVQVKVVKSQVDIKELANRQLDFVTDAPFKVELSIMG